MTGRLEGARVGITRAREQAAGLVDLVAGEGGVPVLLPCLEVVGPESIEPLDRALARLPGGYDGVLFASTNAVRWTLGRAGPGRFQRAIVAAVGPATADELIASGVRVDVVPTVHRAEGLLAALDAHVGRRGLRGTRWLLPRADVAREALPEGLEARGATVDRVVAYRNVAPDPAPLVEALEAGLEAITFASGSAVRRLKEALGERFEPLLGGVIVASIGPVTSRACRELGLAVHVEAAQARVPALVEALAQHRASGGGRRGEAGS